MVPIAGLLMFGIAGCAGNNRADVNNRYNDNARPIGYYSNENHPNQNSSFFNDDDGPITEMMDHTLGTERKSNNIQTRNVNNISPTGTSSIGKLSDQIRMKTAGVDNVQDVRSVVTDSNVFLTVQLKDMNKANQTKKAIRKAIRPYTDGKSVTIKIDNGNLNRDLNRNNDLLERRTR
jgi:spore cortex protein